MIILLITLLLNYGINTICYIGGFMNQRDLKGKNLLLFPKDYVVIDIETTGLSPEYDSIIEVAAIKYSCNKEIDSFTSLIKPEIDSLDGTYIDSFIEELTGITNEMLAVAPLPTNVFPDFYKFIGDSIIVGHNVNFDINFLYDNMQHYLSEYFSNDFVDTMRLSRNLHPEERHHRLSDLIERYNIDAKCSHRALADCQSTQKCLLSIFEDACNIFGDTTAFFDSIRKRKNGLKSSDITTDKISFDITHQLYGKVCVFTGVLEKMVRRDAMQLVANLGGINADSVTKKTNYLILGNNDYCKSIKDGKSSKHKKAEKLKLEGHDIEIISEEVFYDLTQDID